MHASLRGLVFFLAQVQRISEQNTKAPHNKPSVAECLNITKYMYSLPGQKEYDFTSNGYQKNKSPLLHLPNLSHGHANKASLIKNVKHPLPSLLVQGDMLLFIMSYKRCGNGYTKDISVNPSFFKLHDISLKTQHVSYLCYSFDAKENILF